VWLIRYLRRAGGEPRLQSQESAARARGSGEWLEQANLSAGRGDYRGAVHFAYWAGVARLEELGSWAPDRARTPREYLRVLPPGHQHRSMLSALTQRFERIWYGFDPAGPEDFRQAMSHLESMGCQLPSSPATASS
jgi:hypothetical protein